MKGLRNRGEEPSHPIPSFEKHPIPMGQGNSYFLPASHDPWIAASYGIVTLRSHLFAEL